MTYPLGYDPGLLPTECDAVEQDVPLQSVDVVPVLDLAQCPLRILQHGVLIGIRLGVFDLDDDMWVRGNKGFQHDVVPALAILELCRDSVSASVGHQEACEEHLVVGFVGQELVSDAVREEVVQCPLQSIHIV